MIEAATAGGTTPKDSDFLNHTSSVTEQYADYNPKQLAAMSVTAMIKTVAQMKNPRRGHEAQGRLKKVNIDSSAEGYSNFMAPMRISRISRQVEMIKEDADKMAKRKVDMIYNDKILRPATDTYLTAEWDEFVPFPNTWKIRFDGFGKSNYGNDLGKFGILKQARIPEDALAMPPFYQPPGASQYGGSFADIVCVCNTPGKVCHYKDTAQKGTDTGHEEVGDMPKKQSPAEMGTLISTGCGISR